MKNFQMKSLILFVSIFLCSACSKEVPVPYDRVTKVGVPTVLTIPTAQPVLNGNTNEHLLNLVLDLQSALKQCNNDKQQIRSLNEKFLEN